MTDGGDLGLVDLGPIDLGPLPPVDLGVDAGPDDFLAWCEPCATDTECGPTARCLALPSGLRTCVPACDIELPTCPRAFECTNAAAGAYVCSPINGACCIDEDADGYGSGIGCAGLDCNDADATVSPAAPELCNGIDDDCDGTVDGFAASCGEQRCGEAAGGGLYEELGPGSCEMGACIEGARTPCGLYACEGGISAGTRCATTCTNSVGVDDDALCAAIAHCEAGVCIDDLTDGSICDEDTDCAGARCDNGFCCNGGICCNAPSDCPTTGGFLSVCDSPATCQGSTGAASCVDFVCGTVSGVPDDSACTTDTIASECGFFRAERCTGAAVQSPPACPATCADDAACDTGAHCDVVCLPNLPDGQACDEASDCVSGYCNNGVCCAGGDCCVRPSDCPAGYSNPPRCEAPNACQGSRDAAVCVGFVCNTMTNVPDDSACNAGVLADTCGSYPSRFCAGTADQPAPMCAATCTSDGECDADAHCDMGACVPDLEAGRMCDEASDCRSDYCNNGFCCGAGDCCSMASDCPAGVYGRPPTCTSAASCQGDRVDPICTASKQCASGPTIPDDSGCRSLVADTCGAYPSVSCTSAIEQTAPVCASTCTTDDDCDPTAFCSAAGECISRGMTGASCNLTSECATGLSCVDGVCCTSACTGTCRACNIPGSVGTCTNVPAGTDPSNECGAVSCAAYFTAPSGASVGGSCNQVADVPAMQVFCAEGAVCQGAGTLCPGRTVAGAEVLDCENTCQLLAGCAGTTPGRCDAYTPPSNAQTCGIGQCANTVAVCDMGAPLTCTPRAPSTEVCDNLDNDCDGQTDEGCDDDNDDFCDAGLGYVAVPAVCPRGGSDCNDNDAAVNPGATEICNSIDDDCTLGIDQGRTCVRCGDGLIDVTYGEVCDDGNASSGDGCNATCTAIECTGFPSGTSYVAPSGNCYWRSTEVVTDRSTASSRCSARGMHLLYLETSAERSDIRGNLIGFSSTSRVYVGINTTGTCRTCGTWLNGVPLSYQFFRSGEPSGDGTCAEWGPGELDGNDIPCSTDRDFVCERERAGTVRVLP